VSLTYGELFAGYDGLGMGVRSVLGGETRWYADCCKFDKHGNAGHTTPHGSPCAILAHHNPDVPNLGDVTKVDWSAVEPVDVITGGSPCQDLSHAGKRAGMKAGTRSGLWASMCDAIETIRPRLVVWENVRGAFSAEATSAVEPCPICVGDGGRVTLRALGRVLGDLAELGYDARWYGLPASAVGAAHGRFRVFLFATPADALGGGWDGRAPDALGGSVQRAATARRGEDARDLTLLPTPAVNDMGAAYTPETWDAWTERMKAEHGNGNGHGKSLNIEALRLLPTPVSDNSRGLPQKGADFQSLPNVAVSLLPTPNTMDGMGARSDEALARARQSGGCSNLKDVREQDWREYEAAIRRQEHAFGRPAPLPTEPGNKGQPRLSPRFVEWLMALPDGWVTDVPGISRNDQLKALGNGVVPPQAAAATRAFLEDTMTEARTA
jgi:DNA (cytosine-5)-methyltransferase 1